MKSKKFNYEKILQSEEWKKLRQRVFERDGFKCRICGDTKKLQAHHLFYYKGVSPLKTPFKKIITLCDECHKNEHDTKPIKDFINHKVPKHLRTEVKKKVKQKKHRYHGLNERDLELQKRYDKLNNFKDF